MSFSRRLTKLEKITAPTQEPRIVVLFRDPEGDGFKRPSEAEIAQASQVIVVRFGNGVDDEGT